MKPAIVILLVAAAALVAACEDPDEEASTTTSTSAADGSPSVTATVDPLSEIPPRELNPAPWLGFNLQPKEPGTPISAPDPSCAPNWSEAEPIPAGCPVTTVEYDPDAPIGSQANGCELGDGTIRPPSILEMKRRAEIRNGRPGCVNGWQHEWAGLTPEPEFFEDNPFIVDDGVLLGPTSASDRTCIADASGLIKDMRVYAIAAAAPGVEIDLGEPIAGHELPDYDEIYLVHSVYRDEDGILMVGHREFLDHQTCYIAAAVYITDEHVQGVLPLGEDATGGLGNVEIGEFVRGVTDERPWNPVYVFRADDGVLEIGVRHCDPELVTADEWLVGGPVAGTFSTPRPKP
ncbi:MAG TPA: hypothetical protein VMR52_01935 [Dehalococcoidia bacterium]|nr:hypothetical protein [Dehalococcoidia bacterium]